MVTRNTNIETAVCHQYSIKIQNHDRQNQND